MAGFAYDVMEPELDLIGSEQTFRFEAGESLGQSSLLARSLWWQVVGQGEAPCLKAGVLVKTLASTPKKDREKLELWQ